MFWCQGLFARRRQLLLTEGPHLYYVDPVNKVLKGEIPWSQELRPEAKNFKTFFVHTVSLFPGIPVFRVMGGLCSTWEAAAGLGQREQPGWGSCLALSDIPDAHTSGSVLRGRGRPCLVSVWW